MRTRIQKTRVPLSVFDASLIYTPHSPSVKQGEFNSLPIDHERHARRTVEQPERGQLPACFAAAIDKSKSLLNLGPDWNGEDAEPITAETWTRATECLRLSVM